MLSFGPTLIFDPEFFLTAPTHSPMFSRCFWCRAAPTGPRANASPSTERSIEGCADPSLPLSHCTVTVHHAAGSSAAQSRMAALIWVAMASADRRSRTDAGGKPRTDHRSRFLHRPEWLGEGMKACLLRAVLLRATPRARPAQGAEWTRGAAMHQGRHSSGTTSGGIRCWRHPGRGQRRTCCLASHWSRARPAGRRR